MLACMYSVSVSHWSGPLSPSAPALLLPGSLHHHHHHPPHHPPPHRRAPPLHLGFSVSIQVQTPLGSGRISSSLSVASGGLTVWSAHDKKPPPEKKKQVKTMFFCIIWWKAGEMEGGLSARQSALKSLRRSHRKCFKESEAGFSFMKPVYRWIKIKVQRGINSAPRVTVSSNL